MAESQKGPDQEEVVLEAPQGDLPDSGRKGGKTPKGSKSDRKSTRLNSRPKGGKAPEGSKSGPGPDKLQNQRF